jgi:predicted  nucleic acid-binding Zn-ribbon protein
MSEMETIQAVLQGAARRHRLARALRGFIYGLFVGALLSLICLGVYHLFPLPLWVLTVAPLLPIVGMLAGFVVGAWHRPNVTEIARWVDSSQQLKERLSTALEVSKASEPTSWSPLLLSDAAAHARKIDPRRLLPLHLPRISRWAVVVLAIGAGLGFVPEYRSKSRLQKQTDQQNIKETGRLLAELTRHNIEKRPPAFEPTQKSLETVSNLGDQLAKQTLTRSDALKDLANVADKLKDQLKELGKDPGFKRMEQAARNSSGNDSQSASGLQKQIESLQKQLGSPTGTPDALDKIQKNLDKLQQAAKGLADKNSAEGDAERQKISDALSALSKQMQALGMQLPQLDDAINALAANQTDLFLKDLEAATTDLEKMKEMAKSIQQMQQQMEKLGKDLAEQLKNGQPELAQQSLQKMITQLNSANLTPEQLQKLLAEVAKAVAPAGNYGKVADHLEKATQQMKGNDKSGASQSLAAASKELENLMQQMGDAQELASTLDALNQASMCLGTGKCWRPGAGPPKAGHGGRPGSGVGTWADEDSEWNGQSTAGWDNSAVVRPDTEGRGQTERGDGELSDALKPTKVKGQFSQGGQMPSITLKGVSIKGQSKVDYAEAASAAQSDAQSALSQEKVPRAYQTAVKDYFDDLKK